MKDIKDKIRKKYYRLRKSFSPPDEKPRRLIVEKAKWFNNAESPVLLMIDDLANAWHSRNGNSTWDPGGDWGGGLKEHGSAISFLEKNLMSDYPEVKVTFFAVAGRINQYTHKEPFIFSEPLNFNEESKKFFRSLNEDPRFEIAYHGYNHGTPGDKTEDFVQEWRGFRSVKEACEQINKGKEIFRDVFRKYPSGGKYGGWEYNELADESIDRSGFLWWCRDWMPRDTDDLINDSYYEPQFFGDNLVVALPSTIHGFFWYKRQIDRLLRKNQIISIEEHIAPIRPDGLIQTPNIVNDINELRRLFAYLRKKNVWYATGSEIAEYFIANSLTTIYDIKKDSFKMKYSGHVSDPTLTLIVDSQYIFDNDDAPVKIILPDKTELQNIFCRNKSKNCYLFNVPVLNGTYRIAKQGHNRLHH